MVVNPLTTTLPLITDLPIPLTAGVPTTTATYFEVPVSFDWGQLAEWSIDPVATLSNLTVVRTDGGTSPDPTVEVAVGFADGDTSGDCSSGAQAFRVEVTGNEDFTSTFISEDESVMPQSAVDIINSGAFTMCTRITSSVDANITLTGLGTTLGFAEDGAAPQDVSGTWVGDYTCENFCEGEQLPPEGGPIQLTVIQSGGTAIYSDGSGAIYIGSVRDNLFNHLGLGYGYFEYGTFTRTGPNTATKSSTWVDTHIANCGGTCSDTLNLYEPPE